MRDAPLWLRRLAALVLVVLAGLAGFMARGWVSRPPGPVAQYRLPTAADFRDEPSFSEAETARDAISDAAVCYVGEVMARHRIGPFKAPEASGLGAATKTPDWDGALRELGRGVDEFKGTGQEVFLIERTLGLLRAAGRPEAWLTLYLETLYEHPTSPLIGRQAAYASSTAAALERSEELQRAWDWLLRMPFEFRARMEIRALAWQGPVPGTPGAVAAY